ncbi:MAG TPA: FkbM family methyltransferase [Puia sp.]|nr:FkbM family methyltransferase [Puia sp.]
MISSIARWLVKKRFYATSDFLLSASSLIIGSGSKINYNKNGYWAHRQDGWIINEAFPNIRLNIRELRKKLEEIYFYQYEPGENNICVDVGAGIGTESIFLSLKVGSGGKVYAIEASPHTFSILKANMEDNELNNVSCYNAAISDSNGKMMINDNLDNHIVNTVFATGGTEIEAFTMDSFFIECRIDRVDYLKVNIEGAEKLLIRSFNNIKKVHYVAISCHDFLARQSGNNIFFTRNIVCEFLIKNNFVITSRNTGVDYIDDWIYGTNKDF